MVDMILVEGKEFNLVNAPLQEKKIIFIPKSWSEDLGEAIKFAPHVPVKAIWAQGRVMKAYYATEKMPMFQLGDKRLFYKGDEYPVAESYELVEVKAATAIRKYRCNEFIGGNHFWCLPDIHTGELKKLEENYNILNSLDAFFSYDEEADKVLKDAYEKVIENLEKEHNDFKGCQSFSIGDKIAGVAITDIDRDNNGYPIYYTEDVEGVDGELNEDQAFMFSDYEIPDNVEATRFNYYRELEYKIKGKWYDHPDDANPGF